mmetsp:Transcript_8654/g.16393  ORF Transcript_8654/g.16393 Transcript_8654/m.16393 type:complete len:132 (-) Transcript_8654:354-749(-)
MDHVRLTRGDSKCAGMYSDDLKDAPCKGLVERCFMDVDAIGGGGRRSSRLCLAMVADLRKSSLADFGAGRWRAAEFGGGIFLPTYWSIDILIFNLPDTDSAACFPFGLTESSPGMACCDALSGDMHNASND